MAPFDELERLVPGTGEVLDLGCGSGLFSLQLALAGDRRVHGVDISAPKVRQALAAMAGAGVEHRVAIDLVGPGWLPEPDRYDAVIVGDVLYLMEDAEIRRTVRAACAALRPGGRLVVKEVAASPRWKHRVAMTQELLSVRVLRLTEGNAFNHHPLETVTDELTELGWSFERVPLDRGYPYSHSVVLAAAPTRAAAPETGDARRNAGRAQR